MLNLAGVGGARRVEEKYLRCWGAVMKYLRVLEKMGDKYTVSFSHSFIDFPIFRGRVHVSRLVCGVVFIGAEDVGSAWCASRASGSITAAAVKVMAAGSHSHSSDVFKRSLPGCHSWCHCSLLVALMFAIDVFGVIDYCLRGGRSSTVYSSKVGNSHLPCGGPLNNNIFCAYVLMVPSRMSRSCQAIPSTSQRSTEDMHTKVTVSFFLKYLSIPRQISSFPARLLLGVPARII